MTITNSTDKFLILNIVPSLSAIDLHIRDTQGKTPKETDEGCSRHRSQWCAQERQNGADGNENMLEILPGKETSVNVDVSLEYLLDQIGTFTIDVTEDALIAYDAPAGTNPYELGNFPHRNVGHLQSNSIDVQIRP